MWQQNTTSLQQVQTAKRTTTPPWNHLIPPLPSMWKHRNVLHVSSTLSEVLRTNRQCCQGMEAHFCCFYVGVRLSHHSLHCNAVYITPEALETQNHVQVPPTPPSSLQPPSNSPPPKMNTDHPNTIHATGNQGKMLPASWECTSALSGDVGNELAHNCARFLQCQPP